MDAIPVSACGPDVTVDQRGQPRKVDGNVDGTNGCDIGAVEVQPPNARPPGAIHVVKVVVTVRNTAPRNAAVTRSLTARSEANPNRRDTVKFTTRWS